VRTILRTILRTIIVRNPILADDHRPADDLRTILKNEDRQHLSPMTQTS